MQLVVDKFQRMIERAGTDNDDSRSRVFRASRVFSRTGPKLLSNKQGQTNDISYLDLYQEVIKVARGSYHKVGRATILHIYLELQEHLVTKEHQTKKQKIFRQKTYR